MSKTQDRARIITWMFFFAIVLVSALITISFNESAIGDFFASLESYYVPLGFIGAIILFVIVRRMCGLIERRMK